MRPSVLLGSHTHQTTVGTNVHVYERNGKYLARGRYQRKMFGQNLGSHLPTAQSQLRHLLTEIERGTFLRPSEARRRPLRNLSAPQLDLRQLCSEFLSEKRKLRGSRTAKDYQNRLAPILDFAERQSSLKRWPLARDVDRQFALELRVFLIGLKVTRNGRPGAEPKCMSARQVINCLETLRAAFAWAVRADVRKLPPEFVNPLSRELIGTVPAKDPLRAVRLPLDRRADLVGVMDRWQILQLSALLVLPLRFEDVCGALISDVDFAARMWRLGTRFGGSDFNKARLTIEMPIPPQLVPILRTCIDGRAEGPLFRSRAAWTGSGKGQTSFDSREEIERRFNQALAAAPAGTVEAEQDRKHVFRRLLRQLGGISEDQIGKELKALFSQVDSIGRARPYDLRGSVSQDMKDADLRHLELRYLTEHAVGDILNEYVSLDPVGQMDKYFRRVESLLETIARRARSFGINAS